MMPCWYYEKKELKDTPSYHDGIDFETESRYRKEGARFIIDTGTKMDLGYNTMATGVVYFHRFYMHHSFKTFPRYVTACCCLFLAGKVEETPKKCKDIIKIASELLSKKKFLTFGDDPKEEVMTLERILLQTIKFDLQIEHPYSFLLKYAKCLKGDKAKLEKMLQMAWTFVNDSLCTTLSLQWEPEVIAVALMYLAGKLSKFEVVDWAGRQSNHLRWWDMFVEGVTMDLLEDICHQVLDLYSQPQQPNSPDSPPLTIHSPIKKEPKPIPVVGQPIARLSPVQTIQPIVTTTKIKTEMKIMPTNGSGSLPPSATDMAPSHYSYTSATPYNHNAFSAASYQQNIGPIQTVTSNPTPVSNYPATYPPPQYPPQGPPSNQPHPQYPPPSNTQYQPQQPPPPTSQYYPPSRPAYPSAYPPQPGP